MRPARSISPRINSEVGTGTRRALLDSIALQSALVGERCTIESVLRVALAAHRRKLIARARSTGLDPAVILARRKESCQPSQYQSTLPPELEIGHSFVD